MFSAICSEMWYLSHWDSKFSTDNSICNTKWNKLQSSNKSFKKGINSHEKIFPSLKGYNILYIYMLQQCPLPRKIRFIFVVLGCFFFSFCSLLHKNTTCQVTEYLQIYNKFSIFFKFVSRCWIILELTYSFWFLVAIKCVAVLRSVEGSNFSFA